MCAVSELIASLHVTKRDSHILAEGQCNGVIIPDKYLRDGRSIPQKRGVWLFGVLCHARPAQQSPHGLGVGGTRCTQMLERDRAS